MRWPGDSLKKLEPMIRAVRIMAKTINLSVPGTSTLIKSGDLIYDSSANLFKGRVNGANKTIAVTADIPTAAAQADMETGTSSTLWIPVGLLKNHPLVPKALAFCTVSGGVLTVQWSFGMTSVTRSTTGKYYATASTAFSATTAYHGLVTSDMVVNIVADESFSVSKTTTVLPFSFRNASNSYTDPTMFLVVLFGDQ